MSDQDGIAKTISSDCDSLAPDSMQSQAVRMDDEQNPVTEQQ